MEKTKYRLGDRVQVTQGFYRGYRGTIKEFDETKKDSNSYKYKIEFDNSEIQPQWIEEVYLKEMIKPFWKK